MSFQTARTLSGGQRNALYNATFLRIKIQRKNTLRKDRKETVKREKEKKGGK